MRTKGYKCYNVNCGSCICKTLCGKPADTALGCASRVVNVQTNADRIRAMSDEELCKLLMSIPDVPCEQNGYPEKCNHKCAECITKWLQQPAEED